MKYLTIIFTFLVFICNGQTSCPKVFFKSTDFGNDSCQPNIKRVGHNIFKNKISITYSSGKKEFFATNLLWGFQRKNENTVRLVNGNEYEIKFTSPLLIYSQRYFRSSKYYFSIGKDSDILLLTNLNLKKNLDSSILLSVYTNRNIKRHIQ